MELQLNLSQKQIISQKLIQSVNILQMNTQELTEFINDAALENPVIDVEEPKDGEIDPARLEKYEWLMRLDEQNKVYYQQDYDSSDEDPIERVSSPDQDTLSDHLLSQLIGKDYTDEQFRIFEYIAGGLDSKGFFDETPEEIAGFCNTDPETAAEALEIMRSLDPTGVCAENLTGCLLRQLEKRGPGLEIEKEIVSCCMELLGRQHLASIARKLNVPVERIEKAQSVILSLNPIPSRGFSDRQVLKYLTPDVTVVKMESFFDVFINDYSIPALRINQDYLSMLRDPETDKEVRVYLKKKLDQAELIRENIRKRNDTLSRLTVCLVRHQQDFFRTGNRSLLKPYQMTEAAEELDVHTSTVSRAVKDKFLQCAWGIYPLGFFFARSITRDEDASVSAEHVRNLLEELIRNEDKTRPFSDQQLALLLEKQGVEIARRTVAKCRTSMRIPDCRGRKIT